MSNRDSRYGDSAHIDPFQTASREQSGEPKDKAEQVKGHQVMDQASQKGQQAKETAKNKVDEASGTAQHRTDQGVDKAAQGLGQTADMLRQRGVQQGGTAGSMATTAADKLDSVGAYLRDKDTNQLVDDLEGLIRQKPTESLLAAAGVGFVLSKIFK